MRSTRLCTFSLEDDGVLVCTMKAGAVFEYRDAVEAMEMVAAEGGGRRRPTLVNMRLIQAETKEAREHFAGPEVLRGCAAVALLVASPVSRVIANFFLRIGTQPVPTRVFDSPAAARTWLLTHLAS